MAEFVDSTGTFDAEINADRPDGPYPARVVLDISSGSLLSDDARELARLIRVEADTADRRNRAEPRGEGSETDR